jgi:AraC-like DNA-binding protein
LTIKTANLIKSRELLKQKFSEEKNFESFLNNSSSPDKEFLEKIIQSIERNLLDENINDYILKEVKLSRASLYRKIKVLTGKTLNEFITSVRIKNAATLLQTEKYNITEVSYKVGFSSPSYFSVKFKEELSISPSDFIEQLNKIDV